MTPFPIFDYIDIAREGDMALMKNNDTNIFALYNYRTGEGIYLENFEVEDLHSMIGNLGDLEKLIKKLEVRE